MVLETTTPASLDFWENDPPMGWRAAEFLARLRTQEDHNTWPGPPGAQSLETVIRSNHANLNQTLRK